MIAIFALLCSCGLVTFSTFSIVTNNVTVSTHGTIVYPPVPNLHVSGNKILTGDNATVIFHGVDYTYFTDGPLGSWMLPNGQVEWNTWDTTAIGNNLDAIKSWGCNSVRVLATTQWWTQNTSNFQSNLQYFIKQAALRYIYVDFTFWRNSNASATPPQLPYPPYDTIGIINSTQDFVNLWSDVANALKGYPNVVFELWNEPNGNSAAQASWFNVTQQCINAIRATGATNLIVVQWSGTVYADFRYYPNLTTSQGTMSWIAAHPLNDSAGNIVYSTHLYSSGFYDSKNNYTQKYIYSDMLWALNVTGLLSVAAQYPVWVGEIGCSLWATNMTNEYAWYNNTLTILSQYGIGFDAWAWAPWSNWTQWGLITGAPNYQPNPAGQIFQQQISKPQQGS